MNLLDGLTGDEASDDDEPNDEGKKVPNGGEPVQALGKR